MGAGQRCRGSASSRTGRSAAHARYLSRSPELDAFWEAPTPETARAYLAQTLEVLRQAKRTERAERRSSESARATNREPFQVGPYLVYERLGHGAEGVVYRARRAERAAFVPDQDVALKLPAGGDAGLAWHLEDQGIAWPDGLVRTYEWGMSYEIDQRWIARELAQETLQMALERAGGGLAFDQALEVMTVACEAVAWLWQHQMTGWSAHAKNVYRVGERWKIGDFGRVWWDLLDQRQPLLSLRLDDTAMLGGLLVQTLTGKRWEWLFRALNKQPYCSAVYPLTGDRERDEALSAIVNRCWRGDSGGGPLLANAGRGEQTVYDDPLELLDDVSSSLARRSP